MCKLYLKNIAVVCETEKAGSLCNTQASAAVFSRKKWNLIFIESSFFYQPRQRLYYKNAESVLLQKNWFHIPHNSGLFSAPACTALCFHTHMPTIHCSYVAILCIFTASSGDNQCSQSISSTLFKVRKSLKEAFPEIGCEGWVHMRLFSNNSKCVKWNY